jgi:hypothetical protein
MRTRVERPLCLACRKPLRAEPGYRREVHGGERRFGGYGDGYFCGLGCGYTFAVSLMNEVRRGEATVSVTAKGRKLLEARRKTRERMQAPTPPPNPKDGELWLDTSTDPPASRFWNGKAWETVIKVDEHRPKTALQAAADDPRTWQELALAGDPLRAIVKMRAAEPTLGLKEAKDLVDEYRANQGKPT